MSKIECISKIDLKDKLIGSNRSNLENNLDGIVVGKYLNNIIIANKTDVWNTHNNTIKVIRDMILSNIIPISLLDNWLELGYLAIFSINYLYQFKLKIIKYNKGS